MHNPPERAGRLDDRVGIDAAELSFYLSLLGNSKQLSQIQRRLHVDLLHPFHRRPGAGRRSNRAARRMRATRGARAFPAYSGVTSKNTKVTIMSPRKMPHTRH